MVLIQLRSFQITSLILGLVLIGSIGIDTGLTQPASFTNSIGMEFVLIPAGSFTMGSPKNEKGRGTSEAQHSVTISHPFYIQSTEITIKQWRQVMGRRLLGGPKKSDQLPMVKVSWYDAIKFIKRLNSRGEGTYRLPTDAQWEYAARAGSTTAYSWGARIDCTRAMYSNNPNKFNACVSHVRSMGLKENMPAPVKSYPPNMWGLYDMHGNVWEWCQDGFDPYRHRLDPYKTYELTDPLISESGGYRVRRGGSWFGSGNSCRSANRTYSHPSVRYRTTGFRLVKEAQ